MTEPPRRYDVTITLDQDGHHPNPTPVPVHPPRKELMDWLRRRWCELCDHGATVTVQYVAKLAQLGQARSGPASVGGPHGQETAHDAHRLPPLQRLHPR